MEKVSPLLTSAYWQDNLPGFSNGLYKEKSLIAYEYKQTPVSHKGIKIIGLPGQEITRQEAKEKTFWEADPYPHLESQLLNKFIGVIGGKATLFGGETKLWQHLQEVAQEIATDHKVYLDLHNLTPTEAILLIKELVRTKLNYDDLIAGNIAEDVIQKGEAITAKPEYLDYFTKDPKKYSKLAKQYKEKVNNMTADQMLKHKYLVCRHIAAVSSILYEVLRNNQHSILMNGSYLIYHDEKTGNQTPKASVGGHGYNILYVTRPNKKGTQINLSVIDTTFTMNDDDFFSNPDYTTSRLSQACSSLYEYAQLFDFDRNDIQKLAELASQRAKNRIIFDKHIFHFSEKNDALTAYITDYLSLLYQAGRAKDCQCLPLLYDVYRSINNTREEMIRDILTLPPVTLINLNNKTWIKPQWIPELVSQLKLIDFANKTKTKYEIYNILTEAAREIDTDDLQSKRANTYLQLLDAYHQISKHF